MYVINLNTHTNNGWTHMRIEILIREIRESKKLTIDDLAKMSGISKGHLSKIERQEVEPSISTVIRIAKALKVDIQDLYRIEW